MEVTKSEKVSLYNKKKTKFNSQPTSGFIYPNSMGTITLTGKTVLIICWHRLPFYPPLWKKHLISHYKINVKNSDRAPQSLSANVLRNNM